MKHSFHPMGRALCALLLGATLTLSPLAAQAAPRAENRSAKLALEVTEMELEITAYDPRPKAYLYTGGQSDYYFIVWMSSNPSVATVDGDGKVTARSVGKATITAISDHGDRAACEVTVTRPGEKAEAQKPTLSETSLQLVQQYDVLHPAKQLTLTNSDHSFIYVYQWRSSDPNIASVDDKGVVTAQKPGSATITAFASNGQALRCAGGGNQLQRGWAPLFLDEVAGHADGDIDAARGAQGLQLVQQGGWCVEHIAAVLQCGVGGAQRIGGRGAGNGLLHGGFVAAVHHHALAGEAGAFVQAVVQLSALISIQAGELEGARHKGAHAGGDGCLHRPGDQRHTADPGEVLVGHTLGAAARRDHHEDTHSRANRRSAGATVWTPWR